MSKLLLLLILTISLHAHGGRVDKYGGHSLNGDYHKHDIKSKEGGYSRKNWKHWVDFDQDCQDSRAETLIKQSDIPVIFKTSRSCNVLYGQWVCPYTLKIFFKANKTDIDHIVPLKEAYLSGASSWPKEKKKQFANDPDNLLVTSASANRSKGAKDPVKWMPKNGKCAYIDRWIFIKEKYSLKFDPDELIKVMEINKHCKKLSLLLSDELNIEI